MRCSASIPAVSIPHSNTNEAIARVLKEEGYIEDYQVLPETPRPVLQHQIEVRRRPS
jgi:ribosomal protein S8